MTVVIEDELLLITRGGADAHDFTREGALCARVCVPGLCVCVFAAGRLFCVSFCLFVCCAAAAAPCRSQKHAHTH